jgi:hypothetical protein
MEIRKREREAKKKAKREAKLLRRQERQAMKQQRQNSAEIAESQPILNMAQNANGE